MIYLDIVIATVVMLCLETLFILPIFQKLSLLIAEKMSYNNFQVSRFVLFFAVMIIMANLLIKGYAIFLVVACFILLAVLSAHLTNVLCRMEDHIQNRGGGSDQRFVFDRMYIILLTILVYISISYEFFNARLSHLDVFTIVPLLNGLYFASCAVFVDNK